MDISDNRVNLRVLSNIKPYDRIKTRFTLFEIDKSVLQCVIRYMNNESRISTRVDVRRLADKLKTNEELILWTYDYRSINELVDELRGAILGIGNLSSTTYKDDEATRGHLEFSCGVFIQLLDTIFITYPELDEESISMQNQKNKVIAQNISRTNLDKRISIACTSPSFINMQMVDDDNLNSVRCSYSPRNYHIEPPFSTSPPFTTTTIQDDLDESLPQNDDLMVAKIDQKNSENRGNYDDEKPTKKLRNKYGKR